LASSLFVARLQTEIDTASIAKEALKRAMGNDYRGLRENPSADDLIKSAEEAAERGRYRLARETAELAGEVVSIRPGAPPRGGVLAGYAAILDKFIAHHATAWLYGVDSKSRERWPDLVEVHTLKTLRARIADAPNP